LENHIFFPGGGPALDSKALQQIDTLSQLLNGTVLGNACIALVGHSDTSGGEVANMQVAQSRAEAVGAAFRSRLNNPLKIERVLSAGESLPLENISPRSRWQRRVEIRARDCAISM
jgi:outer membrane protein OmpA-like peptidoglycan-associated protein